MKDTGSQGGANANILRTRGKESSDVDVRTFCCKKLRIFRNLWCVRTDKPEGASADILRTRVTGVNSLRFLRTFLWQKRIE